MSSDMELMKQILDLQSKVNKLSSKLEKQNNRIATLENSLNETKAKNSGTKEKTERNNKTPCHQFSKFLKSESDILLKLCSDKEWMKASDIKAIRKMIDDPSKKTKTGILNAEVVSYAWKAIDDSTKKGPVKKFFDEFYSTNPDANITLENYLKRLTKEDVEEKKITPVKNTKSKKSLKDLNDEDESE